MSTLLFYLFVIYLKPVVLRGNWCKGYTFLSYFFLLAPICIKKNPISREFYGSTFLSHPFSTVNSYVPLSSLFNFKFISIALYTMLPFEPLVQLHFL